MTQLQTDADVENQRSVARYVARLEGWDRIREVRRVYGQIDFQFRAAR